MKNGKPSPKLVQVIAAWLRFVNSRSGNDYLFPLNDPLAIELRACVEQAEPSQSGLCLELLHRRDVFGDDLSVNRMFHDAVEQSATQIT